MSMSVVQQQKVGLDPQHRRSKPPGMFASAVNIIRKDLLLEWRGRARVNATLFFAGLTLLLFSFAVGPQPKILLRIAPGFLWLSILLASVLSLTESMRVEIDNAAMEGLRLTPVDARGIYVGKAVVNTVFLFALGLVLVPLAVALYGSTITLGFAQLAAVLLLGTAGISAPGTLYAAIATQARSRDILLPLLLFPILIPGLLGAVKASELIFHGDAMGQLPSWMTLLLAFNVVYWLLCIILFQRVIEE